MGRGYQKIGKKGVICPIYKKGDKRVAKSYREVTFGHSIQDLCRDTGRTACGGTRQQIPLLYTY